MTPTDDLTKLQGVAEAAEQGDWHVVDTTIRGYRVYGISSKNDEGDCEWVIDSVGCVDPDNMDHITTFDPPTVLRLLGRLRRAEAEARRLQENNMMACETPDDDCECCGCSLAREQDAEG